MKRCPKCEFLYDDEQDCCDMDGTRLRFTTKLPTLPAEAAQKKSMIGALTITLLATIIIGIALFILYPPKWHTSNSSPATEVRSANAPDASADSQRPSSQPETSTPAPKSAAPSRDPFAPMETRTEKPAISLPATKPKVMIPGPVNRSIEAKPAINQVPPVNQPSPVSQKPTTPSSSIVRPSVPSSIPSPSVRPVATATATPKPVTQNSNKDSKFNSMVKKAGRFLKKPF